MILLERGVNMQTIILNDESEVAVKTVEFIKQTLAEKPNALICLPAGNTAIQTFKQIILLHKRNEINLEEVRFLALDEWLDISEPESNCSSFLLKHLFDHLNLREEQVKFFSGKSESAVIECEEFDQIIFDHGGLDLIILGLGMNGHLGLNEPMTSFNNYTTIVQLDHTTQDVGQKYFSNKVSLEKGITIGIKHILESKKAILQVTGRAKKEIAKKVLETEPTEEIPATALKLMENSYFIADKAVIL
jgi:glucosamine-6-phosphate isomerase